MSVQRGGSGWASRPWRILFATLAVVLVFTGAVMGAGLGMAALVGHRGSDGTWERWSDVGQAFGMVNSVVAALAVAALMMTSAAQNRSQRTQQAEVSLRQLHVTLTRMAIDSPHLAEVWPRTTLEDPVTQAQYMYANLLLQHAWLQHKTGIATREEMISNLRYLFASPKIRAFWATTVGSRQSVYVEGTEETGLASFADEIWREYEAVLAWAGDGEAPPAHDPSLSEAKSFPQG